MSCRATQAPPHPRKNFVCAKLPFGYAKLSFGGKKQKTPGKPIKKGKPGAFLYFYGKRQFAAFKVFGVPRTFLQKGSWWGSG
ncbi:MAG: hypothetical protein IJX08_09390 [Clostridia bacterium]|nr:hypothetical protein [Clostridia bacterium]